MKISIVIPTKNRSVFLEECLEKIGKIKDIEVIVIDDCSDVKNKEKNKEVCKKYNAKYMYNEISVGAPKARNIGMKISVGEYIWFFDDDDFVSENTVKEVKEYIDKEISNSMIIIPMQIWCDNEKRNLLIPNIEKNNYQEYRKNGHQVNTSCCLIKKELLTKINGWDERLISGQDTDLFLRASKYANIGIAEISPVNIRTGHNDRISVNVKKQQKGKVQFLRKNWNELHIKRKIYYMITFIFMVPYLKKIFYKITRIGRG